MKTQGLEVSLNKFNVKLIILRAGPIFTQKELFEHKASILYVCCFRKEDFLVWHRFFL